MKKLLLAGTALAGFALVAAPASAQGLNLDVGGTFAAYGAFIDQDNDTTLNDFEMKRHAEVHFTGETKLNNGLTVGVHVELEGQNMSDNASAGAPGASVGNTVASRAGQTTGTAQVDDSYMFLSGNWGRVHVGSASGAAYLLQVTAPSADENVDGFDPLFLPVNVGLAQTAAAGSTGAIGNILGGGTAALSARDGASYRSTFNEFARSADKLTYVSPMFNGFQVGASYTPTANVEGLDNQYTGVNTSNNAADLEDMFEVAARYNGRAQGVDFNLGTGYVTADTENGSTTVGDRSMWNAGANVMWNSFSLGAAYLADDTNDASTINQEREVWVVGAGYEMGAFKLGASYFMADMEDSSTTDEDELDRLTVGGQYTYGPGMTFRGTVADYSYDGVATNEQHDATVIMIGTQVDF